MLTVKTSVKPSPLEGLGLFAEERIPKGTIVWKYDSRFDLSFEPAEVNSMPKFQQEFMERYAYLSSDSDKYILCADDARFMNHSALKDNVKVVLLEDDVESRAISSRDIEAGEEILINYKTFDSADATSKDPYLDN